MGPVLKTSAAAVLFAMVGCGWGADPTPEKPSILVVSIDTLRADRVGWAGHLRPTTPFLDGIRERGAAYTRAYSTSSWTVPALASMVSGVYPPSHGVVHGINDGDKPIRQEILSQSLTTVAEVLGAAGYRTYAVVANLHGHPDFGFNQGFDHYRCVGFSPAENVHETLLEWRDEIAADASRGPVLLWLHYFDPHWPYHERQPWLERFDPTWSPERLEAVRRLASGWRNPNPEITTTLAATMASAHALYDAEIAYADDFVRKAFEALPDLEDWFTVVTSDHGEEFLEHGDLGHSMNLHEETVRIPLVLAGASVEPGTTCDVPVSLVDLAPTLAMVAGVAPPSSWQGITLVDTRGRGRRDLPHDRWLLATLDRFEDRRHRRALIGARWKLIAGLESDARWLYDLERDPRERVELAGLFPGETAAASARLSEMLAELAPPPADLTDAAISAEQAEQLRALGYLEPG